MTDGSSFISCWSCTRRPAGVPHPAVRLSLRTPIPSRPVTLLCPFAAGGAGDILTRAAADHVAPSAMSRPASSIGRAPARPSRRPRSPRQTPDGATLGLYSISPFLTVPHLQKLPYDHAEGLHLHLDLRLRPDRALCHGREPAERLGRRDQIRQGQSRQIPLGHIGRARRGAYRDRSRVSGRRARKPPSCPSAAAPKPSPPCSAATSKPSSPPTTARILPPARSSSSS